jgi:hypothetical protein
MFEVYKMFEHKEFLPLDNIENFRLYDNFGKKVFSVDHFAIYVAN